MSFTLLDPIVCCRGPPSRQRTITPTQKSSSIVKGYWPNGIDTCDIRWLRFTLAKVDRYEQNYNNRRYYTSQLNPQFFFFSDVGIGQKRNDNSVNPPQSRNQRSAEHFNSVPQQSHTPCNSPYNDFPELPLFSLRKSKQWQGMLKKTREKHFFEV